MSINKSNPVVSFKSSEALESLESLENLKKIEEKKQSMIRNNIEKKYKKRIHFLKKKFITKDTTSISNHWPILIGIFIIFLMVNKCNKVDEKSPFNKYCAIINKRSFIKPSNKTLGLVVLKACILGIIIFFVLINYRDKMKKFELINSISIVLLLHNTLSSFYDSYFNIDINFFGYELYYIIMYTFIRILFSLMKFIKKSN